MKRSIPIVCAAVCVVLLGTLVSWAGDSPEGKKPGTETKVAGGAITFPGRTGVAVIAAALEKPIDCDLKNVPLRDAIEYLADKLKIDISIDTEGLREEGLDANVPVSCCAKGLRLRSAFSRTLNPLHLDATIRYDGLYITSEQKCGEFVETRVYDVADLVVCRDDKGVQVEDYDSLIDVITRTVCPATWDHNGGKGSISGASLGTARVLVVSQVREVHHEIAELLAQIRAVAAKKSGGDVLPRKVAPPQRDNETKPHERRTPDQSS